LGIIFDDDLKWKTHLDHISKKLSRAIGIIAKLRNYVSDGNLKMICNSFAQCYLQYGSLCWGNSSKTLLEHIQKQQNKIIKIINGIKWFDCMQLDQVCFSLRTLDIANLELAKFMYCYNKSKVGCLIYLQIKPILRLSTKSTPTILEAAHQNVIFFFLLALQLAKVRYIFEERNYGMQYRVQ